MWHWGCVLDSSRDRLHVSHTERGEVACPVRTCGYLYTRGGEGQASDIDEGSDVEVEWPMVVLPASERLGVRGRECSLCREQLVSAPDTVRAHLEVGSDGEVCAHLDIVDSGEAVRVPPCGFTAHGLHESCAVGWIHACGTGALSMACPLCRADITPTLTRGGGHGGARAAVPGLVVRRSLRARRGRGRIGAMGVSPLPPPRGLQPPPEGGVGGSGGDGGGDDGDDDGGGDGGDGDDEDDIIREDGDGAEAAVEDGEADGGGGDCEGGEGDVGDIGEGVGARGAPSQATAPGRRRPRGARGRGDGPVEEDCVAHRRARVDCPADGCGIIFRSPYRVAEGSGRRLGPAGQGRAQLSAHLAYSQCGRRLDDTQLHAIDFGRCDGCGRVGTRVGMSRHAASCQGLHGAPHPPPRSASAPVPASSPPPPMRPLQLPPPPDAASATAPASASAPLPRPHPPPPPPASAYDPAPASAFAPLMLPLRPASAPLPHPDRSPPLPPASTRALPPASDPLPRPPLSHSSSAAAPLPPPFAPLPPPPASSPASAPAPAPASSPRPRLHFRSCSRPRLRSRHPRPSSRLLPLPLTPAHGSVRPWW